MQYSGLIYDGHFTYAYKIMDTPLTLYYLTTYVITAELPLP